ncbi:MAG: phosphoglycerate mutase family protein [Vicinamibacterales bacterium]
MRDRLRLAVATIALLALVAAAIVIFWNPRTDVLLVRHAERAAQAGNDPPLSMAGEQRAETLTHVAGDAGISAVFVSEFQRTQQTAAPLATALGLTPIEIPAADVAALVSEIRSRRGSTILVAGHSNTVPLIIDELGGGIVPAIAEPEFDNLYVLFIPRWGSPRLVRLKYGEPT